MTRRFVLVHGAWHGAWCWDKLLPLLRAAGHEVRAPDLPGHGANEPNGRLSLTSYADYLAGLLRESDGDVILLGHSMGGMAISAAARLAPERIRTLVYLAAFLPRPGDSVFSLMAENRDSAGPAPVEALMRLTPDKRFYAIDREEAGAVFYNGCDARDIEQAVHSLAPEPVLPLSGKLEAGEAGEDIPRVYISCLHDRVIPVAQQRRMAARRPCRELLQLDAGHSPFLSQPEELARILECL